MKRYMRVFCLQGMQESREAVSLISWDEPDAYQESTDSGHHHVQQSNMAPANLTASQADLGPSRHHEQQQTLQGGSLTSSHLPC